MHLQISVFLCLTAFYKVALAVLGSGSSDVRFTTASSAGAGASEGVTQGRSGPDLQGAGVVLLQPGVFIPTHILPTGALPRPAYTPRAMNSIYGKRIIARLQNKLLNVVGWPARNIQQLYPAHEHLFTHSAYLREQLEQRRGDPVLDLGPTPEANGRIYAYILRPSPDLIATFGPWPDHKRIRWSILEVYAGANPYINIIAYIQTSRMSIFKVRPSFSQALGRHTFALSDVLREVPHP